MCPKPDETKITTYQQSKSPLTRGASDGGGSGRKSTILTGGDGVVASGYTPKKTLLGQ